jgi:23S rRNA (pseudouridine1915-N3)-methyltransferase
MKVSLILIGRTEDDWLKEGIQVYQKRLKHYLDLTVVEIPALKNSAQLSPVQQKEKEAELILKAATGADRLFLLDERGKVYTSEGFAAFMQSEMNKSSRHLVFVVGGPFGFSETVRKKAQGEITLSSMTFTHQMVRLFFTEQIYRAMTILKGEKYHHS